MLLQIKQMEKAVEREYGQTAAEPGRRRSRSLLAERRDGRRLAATKLAPWEIGQAAQQVTSRHLQDQLLNGLSISLCDCPNPLPLVPSELRSQDTLIRTQRAARFT